MLFLIRNPYDASVAEFKRIQGHGHTSVVSEDIFKESNENSEWQIRSMNLIQGWLSLLKGVLEKHEGKAFDKIFHFYFAKNGMVKA
jgi:hypothetical protein